MANKVFKVTFSAIYKDDITPEEISDNLFKALRNINDNLIVLNVDEIKQMKRIDASIKKILNDIMEDSSLQDVTENNGCLEFIKDKESENQD
jgi:hypothetical protein